MPNKDAEDVFNKLMDSSDDTEKKNEELEEVSQKRCVEEYNFDGNESVNELIGKFGEIIREELTKLQKKEQLEDFLRNNLGSFFNRIRGAFEQLDEEKIDLEQFILAGITVLRKKFINLFISTSKERKENVNLPEVADKSSEKDVFSESKSTEPSIEESSAFSGVSIPSSLLDDNKSKSKQVQEEEAKISKPRPKKVKKKKFNVPKKLKIKASSDKKELSISPKPKSTSKKQKTLKKPEKPSKIESLAPEKKRRSHLESIQEIAKELDKPAISPMNYEKLSDQELKSVNIGSTMPGSPLYDEILRIKNLIYEERFDFASKELEKLKQHAENREELQSALEQIEDIATNIGVYRSIPVLLKSGDELLNKPEKALKKYEKAEKFAKTIGDTHYIDIISDKISKANERIIFLQQKKRIQQQENDKLKQLVKKNVKRLSKEETLMSLEDLRKYCNVPSNQIDFVEEVIIEMIQTKEIYGKYFTSSQKVMFDKENNREFLV